MRPSRLHASTPPRGFTLIEIMVALLLASMVVLAAHRAFGTAFDLTARLEEERTAHDLEMEARAYLTGAFGAIDLTSPRVVGFRGERTSVRFTTRDASGRPHDVQIGVRDGWLVASSSREARRLLPADAVVFEYLFALGAEAPWMSAWQSPVSAPVAVRIQLGRSPPAGVDTLLFVIGVRG